jgi:hypothetical protein
VRLHYWLLVGALAFLLGMLGGGVFASNAFTFATGTLNANDTEQAQCMVAIGYGPDALTIMAHPNNMVCQRFKELRGRTGRLVFEEGQ